MVVINIILIVLLVLFWIWIKKPFWDTEGYLDLKYESVTIIIPFRNESSHLPLLLKDVENQKNIDVTKIHVILIDDHSSDDSLNTVKSWDTPLKYSLLELPEDKQGKRQALEYASNYVESEWILFTDADCRLPENWLYSMLKKASSQSTDLLFGTVWYYNLKSKFEKLQADRKRVL